MTSPRSLASEEGFTMIELVVAIFIVVVVIGALAVGFVNANDSSLSSQRTLTRFSVVQQQIERIHQLQKQYGFTAIGLTSSPTAGCATSTADPTSPNAFVCGSGCSETFQVESNYNLTTESFPSAAPLGDTNPESLAVNGCTVSSVAISGGQLPPVQYVDMQTGTTYSSSASVPAADPYATIYTYVTLAGTAGCNSSLGTGVCTGDVRRVVLAAVLSAAGADLGSNYPTYATTILVNPVASNSSNTASGLELLGLIS